MVVAKIVHIRNNTMRTFQLQAGDYFYTPRIDGTPCVEGVIEVPPGFDQATDGLVIPWESLSQTGLEISEDQTGEKIRVVVGPVQPNADNDWLQLYSPTWEPMAQERWLSLGRRHMWGTIGSSVDIQLTFRDARQSAEGPAGLVEVTHFDYALRCAAQNTVFLNVFDLASALSIPNAMLCNTVFSTVGAFHAAVEVYGEEWSFYRTPNPTSCGVCKSLRPRHHPVHVYRQSVNLGVTTLKDWEVRYLIRGKLAAKWPGGGYNLLHRNCIHFCDELLLSLGVKPVPAWVRGLHETGASVLRVPWPLSVFVGSTDRSKWQAEGDERPSEGDARPGALSPPSTGRLSAFDPGRAPSDGTFVEADDSWPAEAQTRGRLGEAWQLGGPARSASEAPPDSPPLPIRRTVW